MNAADVMTRNVVSVGADTPVREAIRLMLDRQVSGLPVVDDGGKLVGILTEGDLLRRGETGTERKRRSWLEFLIGPGRMAGDYVKTHARKVGDIMTREIVAVAEDTPLAEVVELMERHRVKRVPVVYRDAPLGIVSRADLLRALAQALDSERNATAGDDDAIRARILADLEKTDWAPREGLTITVAAGVVRLDGVILDEHEREALRVAAENVPGVKAVEDRLVWVEPVSGTVIEAPDGAAGAAGPVIR
jgi:CBS domain-containing protein